MALKASFNDFLRFMKEAGRGSDRAHNSEALFAQFLEWRARQQAQQPSVAAPAASSVPSR
ncbi:hypothetical protein DF3PB_6110004 [uncultured Defluviicoccus sp.]|uniref:Uncharacterized protein n=1 Tax=metagenome TaxID=256318 RepID=A0A380TJC2_9ZZZZ|nr:hypothetical protein DF3PB_6110004 [uncultured Defluviicoccus sp.]